MEKDIKKKSLLGKWKNRENKEPNTAIISKAPKGVDLPLSKGQQRLFFLDRLYPNNPVYNSSEIYTFKGKLDEGSLEKSLQKIFLKHDVFSCSFHFTEGSAVQRINEDIGIPLLKIDLSSFTESDKKARREQFMREDSLKPFDLKNPPLIRVSLLKLSKDEHILFITVHHIITDKWSMGIFHEELARFYRNEESGVEANTIENELQFTDFAYWENQNNISSDQLDYWKNKLSNDVPLLDLPADYPVPARPTFKGGSDVQHFSKELSEKILELAKKLETTPYTVLLSAYYLLLYRYTGQKDILIGSPISVRASKALEGVIGFFDETIVLRTELSDELTFVSLVERVRKTTLEAFQNKDVPFDVLVKELRPKRYAGTNPFFRTMFIYHPVPEQPIFSPELDVSYTFYNSGISKFDLTLYVASENGLLYAEFEYAKDIFELSSIQKFQEHLKLLLEGITENDSQRINEIPMLTEAEQLLLQPKELAGTKPFERYSSIHEIIIEQAKKTPNSIALVFENESITYKELNEESDLVAKNIVEYSKGQNQIIGLCLERSAKMMIGLLGILKAGCAYLPIDLNYPAKRIDFILQDSKVKILLTETVLESNFEDSRVQRILIDRDIVAKSELDSELPLVSQDAMAYVIYTSGSTGKPKGVPITHANIISSTEARLDFYPKNPDAFLLMSSISFDSSKAGVFWTLCTGGTLVISEPRIEQDIQKLAKVIHTNSVSHTLMLPSLYKMVLDYSNIQELQSLEVVIVAGEECTHSLCQVHFKKLPEVELYNEYGPTEATVWCIAHKIDKNSNDTLIPIGKAISNSEIYLLNESKEVVPFGAVGEIYVGGTGLSGTYLNRPELTKSVYIGHPFSKDESDVLYKTGDLGRYRNDGLIEFLGRTDNQVKVRGFRIELNEIENALMKDKNVREAIVMAEAIGLNDQNNNKATKRLVAYVVTKEPIDTKALQRELISEIPSYMIPTSIIDIDKFPELPNGKVDTKALQEFGEAVRLKSAVNITKPTNEIESKLVEIWEEVLNHSNISTRDDYFEIGGDSMTSIKMFWLIEKSMNVKLSPGMLFNNSTIVDIAKKITNDKIDKTKDFKHVVPYRIMGEKHPLFCIHGGEGHVLFYQNFANYLDSDRPVYFVQPKGADGDSELHTSIEQMGEAYLEEILKVYEDGPINLVFYCCGALVVELSNRLKSLGKVVNIIIVDSSPKYRLDAEAQNNNQRYSFFLKKVTNNPFRTISKSIIYRFRRYVLPIYVSLLRDEFVKRHIRIRARLEEVQNDYVWKAFDANCTLILGRDGLSDFDKKDIDGWNHWCDSEVKVLYNSGNHFNIFEKPHAKSLGETVEGIMQVNKPY